MYNTYTKMNARDKKVAASDNYWLKEGDKFSRYYSTKNFLLQPSKLFLQQRMSTIISYLDKMSWPQNAVALDAGCGSGEFTCILPNYFSKVIGIDCSQMMIDNAKQKSLGKNIEYHHADCTKIPAPSDSIDCLFALGLFDYVKDMDKVFEEFVRLIKANGMIVFTIPHTPSFFEPLRWLVTLRYKLFKLPPIVNMVSKRRLLTILKKYDMELLDSTVMWTAMWIVRARVRKSKY